MMTLAATMVLAVALPVGTALAQSDDAVMNATESGSATSLSVEDVWSRPSPLAEGVGVAYMRIINGTAADDALVGASSPAAAVVELHETTADSEGTMSMAPVDSIPVVAGGEALLEPGGYHLMLVDLVEPLVEGGTIELTLEFETAGSVTAVAQVLAMDAEGPVDGTDTIETETETTAADLPTEIKIESYDNYFQPNALEAPANTEIKVTLNNYGFLPHNVAFYTDESATTLLAEGSITAVIDPELEASVRFTTPGPGEYFLLCVIHPEMTGTLIVR